MQCSLNRPRVLAAACSAVTAALVSVLSPAGALAGEYNGLLDAGVTSASASSNAYAANSVVAQQSWSAPSGVQFHGFAYTAATFGVANEDATGGLSAGFAGSGGSAPTDLSFPWTVDCSISEETPRTWIQSGGAVTNTSYGPFGVAPGSCNTSGDTAGWNFTNAEVESTNTGENPGTDFQKLTLSIWCARDSNCGAGDAASYAVTNLSGTFDDSSNQPSGSASWNTSVDAAKWYQTNTGNLKLDASASDPAGVCSMAATLSGPATVSATLGNQNPSVLNPGNPIGVEFQSGTDPCWTGTT